MTRPNRAFGAGKAETDARLPPDRWMAILLTVAGAGGFVGLLVLGSRQPGLGDYACSLAIVWLIALGLLRCQIDD